MLVIFFIALPPETVIIFVEKAVFIHIFM
jgi:hypothetical protein